MKLFKDTDILFKSNTLRAIIYQLRNTWDNLDGNNRRFSTTITELEDKDSCITDWRKSFVPMMRQMLDSINNEDIYFLDIKEVLTVLRAEGMIEVSYKENGYWFYITLKDRRLIEMAGGTWITDEEYNDNKTIDAQVRILNDQMAFIKKTMTNLKKNKTSMGGDGISY